MRSRSGAGIGSSTLAVVMNSTSTGRTARRGSDRGTCPFCSGSSTSSSADEGSPRKSDAELVDLVEDEHRVLRLGPPQALHDLARQRADVGAAVAADLGLVAHAAERHAHELAGPATCAIDRASDVLPTPGGPTKQRIGPFSAGLSLRTARYSRMRSFSLLEPRVLRVEHLLGACTRSIVSSVRFGPRQRDQPVEVGARHRVLGRGHRHLGQAVEFAQRFLLDRRRACRRPRSSCAAPRPPSSGRRLRRVPSGSPSVCSRRKYSRWLLADLGLHLRLNLRAELQHLEFLHRGCG